MHATAIQRLVQHLREMIAALDQVAVRAVRLCILFEIRISYNKEEKESDEKKKKCRV
jgi:hypothetical protein